MAVDIPYISYHMIIDALRPCTIISEPERKTARFKWVSSVHWEKGVIPERDMLFVCSAKAAPQAAALYPGALLIVMADAPALEGLGELGSPMIVVEQSSAPTGLLQKLQNYFLLIQSWQSELAHVTTSPDGFRQMLNKSARIIGAPLLLYGNDAQPLAKALTNIGSPLCKDFLCREREIVNSVRMIRRSPVSFKNGPSDLVIENATIGEEKGSQLLLMALYEREPSRGQRDLFDMLATSLSSRADLQTGRFDPVRYSFFALFDDLVNGRYVSRGQLNDYASNIRIPLDAEFRLLCFEPREGVPRENLSDLALTLKRINGGRSATVVYDDRLYLLLYSKGLDNSLSNRAIEEQLLPHCDPAKGFVAVSQVFDEITNVKFAYQQIQLVSKYKDNINLAYWFTMSGEERGKLCYTFEEALRFLVVDSDEMSPALRDFSFSHTILDKIIAENAANGGDDARILATYIHYERKATVVAEKLHMHRNTVLYRIGKIENRFGLDFDENWSRDRLLFDFSILYSKLIHDPELFRKIVGCSFEDLFA
ncbi:MULTISPECIES: CdaR family transcriptional regulator [unclassified Adlercreutzia]|uniref:PucR family transcriptional regulator n=1 Tax=unclassified Adlercreutzia TaxID=2636013 RepID=UPI0013ED5E0A|nr:MULTISPECIES: helix-turn-helix domain-containing protein [unclassified Adlercreutzia]